MTSDDKPDTPDPEVVEGETTAVELTGEDAADETPDQPEAPAKKGLTLSRVVAFIVLPILAVALLATAGYFGWNDWTTRDSERARTDSVQVAKDSTVALLSYKAETVDKDLGAARDRLTGSFLDAYTQLVNNVVIPGAKEKKISAVAQVPAAASVSVSPKGEHAVVLLFVNQTVVMGTDAPTSTASSVRVTLDKVGDRWLISGFDPV